VSVRVHRLIVAYPEGSHDEHGQPVRGWEPPGWNPDLRREEDSGALAEVPFAWPKARLYLSASGAGKRAILLRSFGATVNIEASNPVTWGAAP
jgi:hypothetical protein